MMPFLLLVLGLFLIFAEFYLPGAILGVMGGISMIVAIMLFSNLYGSPILTVLFTLLSMILLGILIKFALWKIQNEKKGSGIYSYDDQAGYTASTFDSSAIGKIGIAHTDLRPGGQVLIEGKRHTAISQSGYLEKGTRVLVTGGEGESLTVKLFKENTAS